VGLRFNPGLGSGEVDATNVGGPASSFGIWYESVDKVREILKRFSLRVVRIHTHIGSGTDVKIWNKAANLSLRLCKAFPHVKTLNLGGGFKVARMKDEISTDIQKVGEHIKRSFELFQEETGRELHLEIEPGNYLCTSAGALVCTIQDVTSTSRYDFLKLDSGMTEILRPMLYGSQHNIVLVRRKNVESTYQIVRDAFEDDKNSSSSNEYVVVGKCCESGDLLTCKKNTPARIRPRNLLNRARIGDLIIVEGCGSYCSSMCAKHYNSYPTAAEVMCFENGNSRLIRRRGVLQDAMSGEICLEEEAFLNSSSCDGGSRKSLGFSARAVFLLTAFVLAAVGRGRSS
jgi:diaminopimelate decarboxylase